MPNKKLPCVFDAAVLEDPDGWMDDEHITAAQHLLQEQHSDVAGLQVHHCSRPEHLMFTKTTHSSSVSMRMATTGITVSTVGCSSGVVQVFDSSHHLSHSRKCIIAYMLQASKDSIVLEYIAMLQQSALLKKKAREVLGLRGVTAQGVLWQHTRVLS